MMDCDTAQETLAARLLELGFGLGPAGTGKTYLAGAVAVSMHTTGQVDRIILSRPALEAAVKSLCASPVPVEAIP